MAILILAENNYESSAFAFVMLLFCFLIYHFFKNLELNDLRQKTKFFEQDFEPNNFQYSSPLSQYNDKKAMDDIDSKFKLLYVVIVVLVLLLILSYFK